MNDQGFILWGFLTGIFGMCLLGLGILCLILAVMI